MKKTFKFLMIAVLIAAFFASCSDDDPVKKHVNTITLDGVEMTVDSTMFWYQSSMGGDPYLRLIFHVEGQDNPDLLKLYPNKGLGELPGTYTFDNVDYAVGTYDAGYTANYAGMAYDWTAIAKTGTGSLVIEELSTGEYSFKATIVLSVGTYDWSTGDFTETETKNLTLDYIGEVTPL